MLLLHLLLTIMYSFLFIFSLSLRRLVNDAFVIVPFLTSSEDSITISLIDVSEKSDFFTPPQFLHEVSLNIALYSSSRV